MKGMRGRRVLCLVTVCALAFLIVASAASAQGVNTKDLPPPSDSDPGLPSGVGEAPKGGPPKDVPPNEEPPGDAKELLKAGGDLPPPQRSATPLEADNGGRFPLWRVVGIILSAGVFVISLYQLLLRT